jgi:hypothetical protein
MFMISIGATTANASLINFDNLLSLQDVGGAYSSLGVHFTPGDFIILTQGQSLVQEAVSPSFPNVATLQGVSSISFNTPQSSVVFKYGTSLEPMTVTATGPNFSQSFSDSVSSFPNIDRTATFTAQQPSITSLSFNQLIYGTTVIDDLVFSSTSGSQRAKDRTIPGIGLGVSVAGIGLSVAEAVAAVPTGGLSTLGLLGEFVGGVGTGLSLAEFLDPFDPNYSQKFSAVFVQLPLIPADATLPQALADEANGVLNHGSKAVSFLQALYASSNRLNSAIQVGDQTSIDLQRSAVDTYLALASSELDQYSRGLQALNADLSSSGLDIQITLDQINAFLNDLGTRGFTALPQQEQVLFDLFGFDAVFKQSVIDGFLSVNPLDVPQSLLQAQQSEAIGFGDLSFVYAGPNATPVPEPSTIWTFILGTFGLVSWARIRYIKKSNN